MVTTHTLLYGQLPPHVFLEYKKTIHLSESEVVGDWYIYQEYIVLRLYGFELKPFQLPAYLTKRLFALEFVRRN